MPASTTPFSTEQQLHLIQKISEAFSPSAPIDQQALFAGRIQQVVDVVTAVNQKGQHVILYGERGVGKTSLATVATNIMRAHANTMAAGAVNCDQTADFASLWRTALREIRVTAGAQQGIGFTAQQAAMTGNLADYLGPEVTPDSVRSLLQRIGKTIIVFDEVDRIADRKTATLMADTIKNLSDHAVNSTVILVGVADTVEALIGEHQSVERALVQIRMPRMTMPELEEIITKGATHAGMSITDDARRKIAALSQGLPHYVHLVSLNAFRQAVVRDSLTVTIMDVRAAIEKALSTAQQSTIAAYHRATSSPRENLYPQVLLACALAKVDDMGYFASVDVREPLSRIMGKAYDINAFSQHLNAFCDAERGPILQRIGVPRRFRFRFNNPLMQPYVVMHGVTKGLIGDTQLSGQH